MEEGRWTLDDGNAVGRGECFEAFWIEADTAHWQDLGAHGATRSPASTPASIIASAAARTCSSKSSKVTVVLSSINAGCPACSSAARSTIPGMVPVAAKLRITGTPTS
jgi:hypothetical protein